MAVDSIFIIIIIRVDDVNGSFHCRRFYNSLVTSGICRIVSSGIFELMGQVQWYRGFHRQERISVSLRWYHPDIDRWYDIDLDIDLDVHTNTDTGVGPDINVGAGLGDIYIQLYVMLSAYFETSKNHTKC